MIEVASEERLSKVKCPKCGEFLYSTLFDDTLEEDYFIVWQCKSCDYIKHEHL